MLLLLRAYFLAKAYVVYDKTAFGSATLLRWGAVVGSCYIFNSKNERKRGGSSTPSHGRYQRTGEQTPDRRTLLRGFRILKISFPFLSLHVPAHTLFSPTPTPICLIIQHSFIHTIYHRPPILIPSKLTPETSLPGCPDQIRSDGTSNAYTVLYCTGFQLVHSRLDS